MVLICEICRVPSGYHAYDCPHHGSQKNASSLPQLKQVPKATVAGAPRAKVGEKKVVPVAVRSQTGAVPPQQEREGRSAVAPKADENRTKAPKSPKASKAESGPKLPTSDDSMVHDMGPKVKVARYCKICRAVGGFHAYDCPQPRADAVVQPKHDAVVQPKDDAAVQPKADATVQRKADATVQPKADATVQ